MAETTNESNPYLAPEAEDDLPASPEDVGLFETVLRWGLLVWMAFTIVSVAIFIVYNISEKGLTLSNASHLVGCVAMLRSWTLYVEGRQGWPWVLVATGFVFLGVGI